jgi:hypothetical protein
LIGAGNGSASQPHDGSGANGDTERAGEGDHGRVTAIGDLVAALHRTRVTLAGTTAASTHFTAASNYWTAASDHSTAASNRWTAGSTHWIGRNGDAAGHSEGRDVRDEGFVKHNCED